MNSLNRYVLALDALIILWTLMAYTACEPVKETTWTTATAPARPGWTVPLSIVATSDVDRDELNAAISLWNRQGGCKLFELATSTHGDVLLDHGNPTLAGAAVSQCTSNHVACTFLLTTNSKVQAPIFLVEPQGRGVDAWIWAHELGHALG